jgi:heme exporter protein C
MLSLPYFYRSARRFTPYLGLVTLLLMCLGLYMGLFVSPKDYQQGEGFRIIYVHVPAAFFSLGIYAIIFCASVVYLIWRLKIADIIAKCSATIGASFTFIALITGAIWGKPMWGTYWVWDARLTSELILLFLYFGYIGLRSAILDHQQAAKACAILAIVGMVDIPIIHFSVEWWQTLHQGATLAKFSAPSMNASMIVPLYILIVAFGLYYLTVLLVRVSTEILNRESDAEWVNIYFGSVNRNR